MDSILVTGGAGFIGANFINYFIKKYRHYFIINLDKLTAVSNLDNLEISGCESRYEFIHGDICDSKLVKNIFAENNIKGVIHFAAESHVDRSIVSPEEFVNTNVLGTFVLLDAARKMWLHKPFDPKPEYTACRFHHVSTDEVFGTLGEQGYFTEESRYAPTSPYSASKGGSDMIARSYFHTYGLNVSISNCSNNYGKYQYREKLIPTIIHTALSGQDIPIYGNGMNIRDWLHVEDHCSAIDLIYHQAQPGESYVVGGGTEKTNMEVVKLVCDILDVLRPKADYTSYNNQVKFVQDRAGHDFRYALDSSKINRELRWNPTKDFYTGLYETIQHYIKDPEYLCSY